MDPFLEVTPYWRDFSPAFQSAIRNQLLSILLPRYDVCLEENTLEAAYPDFDPVTTINAYLTTKMDSTKATDQSS